MIIFRDQIGDSDVLMTIARICISFAFMVSGIIGSFPLKIQFQHMLEKHTQNYNNLIATSLVVFISSLNSYIFPNIKKIFALGGTISCMNMIVIMPLSLALKKNYVKKFYKWVLIYCIIV